MQNVIVKIIAIYIYIICTLNVSSTYIFDDVYHVYHESNTKWGADLAFWTCCKWGQLFIQVCFLTTFT